MQNYKDLKVWEKAHLFTVKVYEDTRGFPKEEVYGLTSQLRKAAYSIPANIAEGCGKNTKNDFANFLNIALGSANETDYCCYSASELKYISQQEYETINKLINEVRAMLISFLKFLRDEK